MSNNFFEMTIGGPCKHFRGAELGCYVIVKLTKKAAVKLSDHTPIAYLWSTSLASFNLKNGFRCFVPQIICHNNQFSTPENAHRYSLQSFELILLLRSFVSRIVKKTCVEPKQKTNIMHTEMLEIVFTPKILGAPEIGGPRLKPF